MGNIKIGDNVRIGAGSVVVNNVPKNSTVVGVPGRVVRQKRMSKDGILMHNKIPDPIYNEINKLKAELIDIKSKLDN